MARQFSLRTLRIATLLDAKVLVERWGCIYNTVRPHSSPGYRPPHRLAAHVVRDHLELVDEEQLSVVSSQQK
jgi:hypothetical protein